MIFVFIGGCAAGEEVTEPPGAGKASVGFGAKLFWTGGLGTISLATKGSAGVLLFRRDGATGDAAGVLGLGEGTVMQGGEEGRGVNVPSGTSSSSFSSDPFVLEISWLTDSIILETTFSSSVALTSSFSSCSSSSFISSILTTRSSSSDSSFTSTKDESP